MSGSTPTTEQVQFPLRISPIGIYFIVVSALAVGFAVTTFLTTKLPIILMVLLFVVVGCCVVLAKNAIDEMGPVTIEWSNQGVTVRRALGTHSYYWSHIERVELFDPGATFGDLGRHEESRTAIGLFIRDPAKANRPSGDAPDVMLVSRAGEAAEKIPKLSERLANAKRYGGGKDARKIGGGLQAGNSRGSKQFRRSAPAVPVTASAA